MYQSAATDLSLSKAELYAEIALQLRRQIEGERNAIPNAANFSAPLFDMLPDLNWCGFYFMDDASGGIVVGPFEGKPACVRIAIGRGVCGMAVAVAVAERQSVVVPDVHAFPGHIACDAASRSEIVVTLLKGADVIGVLDLNSHSAHRFDDGDRLALSHLVATLLDSSEF